MLEYSKTILEKVSFDQTLFEKELSKAIDLLTEDEAIKLKKWCQTKFDFFNELSLEESFEMATLLA
ncbi:hypothetical protein V6R21_29090 [Limibacter armeniacum]|uniref:hypothetical protein n=1 Tax=Limibacter armeniacum TaxID=466084 RepID=UPI002FE5EA60